MDGFINLDKSAGISSQYAVSGVKRLLSVKAGHCGTLDPLATGVLPICVGKATRLAEYVVGQPKRYLAEICLGVETDSYDAAGEVLFEREAAQISAEMLHALLPKYIGDIMQTPPLISALKRDGEPLYRRARRGEQIELEPRPVKIYSLRLLEFIPGRRPLVRLEIDCGQGAYIRSLAHDLGRDLGVGAHIRALRRLAVGAFRIEDSYGLERLAGLMAAGSREFLIPMARALAHIPALTAGDADLARLLHGNDAPITGQSLSAEIIAAPALRLLDRAGQLLGIGHIETGSKGDTIISMDKVLASAPLATARELPPAPLWQAAEMMAAQENPAVSVAAIGNFDGLHLGHRALFAAVRAAQARLGGQSAVVTFHPHPLTVIRGQPPPLITGEQLKPLMLKESFGVDHVVTLDFDRRMMNSSPEKFVQDIIIDRLRAREIVVGYNFTYAAHGAGTAELLQRQCAARGVRVTIVDEVSGPYGVVSSSNIRRALENGDLAAANAMLGYWFAMQGQVIYGNQIGRSLGFPTANFLPEPGQALPRTGVYASRILHQGRLYDGVSNFGVKPTIGGEKKPLVEAHIFDADIDLYGQTLRVYFGHYLRPEKRFSGLDELKAQIAADSLAAREFLRQHPQKFTLPQPLI